MANTKCNTRCERIFNHAPISLWEEDYTKTKELVDNYVKKLGLNKFIEAIDSDDNLLATLIRSVKILRINKKTMDLFGVKNIEELLHLESIFCHESMICFKKQMIALAKNKTSFEDDGVNKTLDGRLLYFVLKWDIHDNDYSSVLVSLLDITAIKEAEAKISNLNEKYKNLIERTETSYLILNESLEIIESNDIFCKLTGFSKEYLNHLPIWKIFMDNDKQCEHAICSLNSCCIGTIEQSNNAKPIELTIPLKSRGNTSIWVDITASAFTNGKTKIFCIIRNISDKKREELIKYIEKQKQKDKIKQNIIQIRNCIKSLAENK